MKMYFIMDMIQERRNKETAVMKKLFGVLSKFLICFLVMSVLGILVHSLSVSAGETNNNPLLNGITIEGPEYIYEFEQEAEFYLSKEGYPNKENAGGKVQEDKEYEKLHYEWKSSDKNIAKYKDVNYYESTGDCSVPSYPVLERRNIFRVKKGGRTVISCTISDDQGNSVTVSKQLTVLKGTPIKKLEIGGKKLNKSQKHSVCGSIYTNVRKKVKLELSLAKGWKAKKITVYHDTKNSYINKNITKKRTFSLKSKNNHIIYIDLVNEKTGQTFHYECFLERYVVQKIKLGRLYKGCALVTNCSPGGMAAEYTVVMQYKKNSKKKDAYSFKGGKDLVKKLKKYYGYTSKNLIYKNGKLFIKNSDRDMYKWTYCKSEEELKETVKAIGG